MRTYRGIRLAALRAGRRRYFLRRNLLKKVLIRQSVDFRRNVRAWLGEVLVSLRVEDVACCARLLRPTGKFGRRDRVHVEIHVGESVAAEMRGESEKDARLVRLQ